MKKARWTVAVSAPLVATCLPLAASAQALEPSALFEKVSPSVWSVRTFDSEERRLALGSAVVIGPGRLVTNCHVLAKAHAVQVRRDNMSYDAKLEHADTRRDLCILEVRSFTAPAVAIGSAGSLKVGQRVYAIGSPRGLELTLSEGLISGLRSEIEGVQIEDGKSELVQTTAPISPGSSGGGLFDQEGRLIGITTFFRREAQSINFAVPAEWIAQVPARAAEVLARRKEQAASRTAAAASGGAMPASPDLPPVGMRWKYRFKDGLYGIKERTFVLQVTSIDRWMVHERLDQDDRDAHSIPFTVASDQTRFVERALGGGQSIVEFAPYLPAALGGELKKLESSSAYGYPVGNLFLFSGIGAWMVNAKVSEPESVSVPAGTFRAQRIELQGSRCCPRGGPSRDKPNGRFVLKVWYAPEAGRYVKLQHQAWDLDGQASANDVVELIEHRTQ